MSEQLKEADIGEETIRKIAEKLVYYNFCTSFAEVTRRSDNDFLEKRFLIDNLDLLEL